jgi:hypothetical protein
VTLKAQKKKSRLELFIANADMKILMFDQLKIMQTGYSFLRRSRYCGRLYSTTLSLRSKSQIESQDDQNKIRKIKKKSSKIPSRYHRFGIISSHKSHAFFVLFQNASHHC